MFLNNNLSSVLSIIFSVSAISCYIENAYSDSVPTQDNHNQQESSSASSNNSIDKYEIDFDLSSSISYCYSNTEILQALSDLDQILEKEDVGLNITDPALIIGDLHGDIVSLIIAVTRFINIKANNPDLNLKLVFLGDYVDRGSFSIEVITALAKLKVAHPNDIFLIRGNHEQIPTQKNISWFESYMPRNFDKYNDNTDNTDDKNTINKQFLETLKNRLKSVYSNLPLYAVAGPEKNRWFCAHGGIPKTIDKKIDQVITSKIPSKISSSNIETFRLLWSDPGTQTQLPGPNVKRGGTYSPIETQTFCKTNQVKGIIRAHQWQIPGECAYTQSFRDEDMLLPNQYKNTVLTVFGSMYYSVNKNNTGKYLENSAAFLINQDNGGFVYFDAFNKYPTVRDQTLVNLNFVFGKAIQKRINKLYIEYPEILSKPTEKLGAFLSDYLISMQPKSNRTNHDLFITAQKLNSFFKITQEESSSSITIEDLKKKWKTDSEINLNNFSEAYSIAYKLNTNNQPPISIKNKAFQELLNYLLQSKKQAKTLILNKDLFVNEQLAKAFKEKLTGYTIRWSKN